MSMANIGFYTIRAKVKRPDLVGNPTLTVKLGVNAGTGHTSGTAEITQSLPPPYGKIIVPQVTGFTHHLLCSPDKLREVKVKGQYVVSAQPPAIGSWLANFTATLMLKPNGNGEGEFSYGDSKVTGCTVTNLELADTEVSFEATDLETA